MEIILAFGLGVVLVINIVIVNVALKSNKQVNELSKLEYTIDNIHQHSINNDETIYREIDKVNSKIDSRFDKLNDITSKELEEVNRKVEWLRKSLGKDYF